MTQYYVDSAADPGGDGTTTALTGANCAFKTIAQVNAASFSGGDTISFKRGCTWREQMIPPSSGTDGNIITFNAYGAGNIPIISGADDVSGDTWTDQGGNVWRKNIGATEPKVVVFNGSQIGTNDATPDSNYEWTYSNPNLDVYATSNPNGYYSKIEISQRDYIIFNIQQYIKFQNLQLECSNGLANIITYHNAGPIVNVTVDNIISRFAAQFGILFINVHVTYKNTYLYATNNIVYDCGATGIASLAGCNYTTITGNTVYRCNWNAATYHSGIHVYGNESIDNATFLIEYNEVYDNILSTPGIWDTGKGITADAVASGGSAVIRYNNVYNNDSIGIMTENSPGVQIYYNLSYGNGEDGILVFRDCNACHVYNNVTYNNKYGISVRGYAGFTDLDNNLVKNNISIGNSTRQLVATIGGDNDGVNGSGNVYTYNCLGAEATSFIEWGAGTYKSTYDAWETAYGSSTYSVEADPLFVNAAGGNFHIQSGSPCHDAGIDVSLTEDYAGQTIIGLPDIGAYEYGYFYVNSAADAGGDGTTTALTGANCAFKTIAQVNAASFSAGDIISFNKGCTWRESLIPPSSGSVGNPITFTTYGSGNAPVLTGYQTISGGWSVYSGNIYQRALATQPYSVRIGTTFGKAKSTIWGDDRDDLTAEFEWFWGSNVLYIYSAGSDPETKYGSVEASTSTYPPLTVTNVNYVTVDGLCFTGSGNLIACAVTVVNSCSNIIVKNCEIKETWSGILSQSSSGDNTYQNNIIHSCHWAGIEGGPDLGPTAGHENLLSGNTIYDIGTVAIWAKSNYWIMEYNKIYNVGVNPEPRLGVNWMTVGIDVFSTGADGAGSYNVIRYNEIYDIVSADGEGTAIEADQYTHYTQIYYNLCYNNDGSGVRINSSAYAEVYNNTLYNNSLNSYGEATLLAEILVIDFAGDHPCTDVVIKNNIAYGTQANDYAIYVDASSVAANPTITNNIYYAAATNWYYWGGVSGNNLATWNGYTGVGTDLNSDPLFVNAAGGDFHVQTGSPCINAGVAVGLTVDRVGKKVVGLPDMGAYEYGYYYTRSDEAALPGDADDLSIAYDDQDYLDVALDDSTRVDQGVVSGHYAIHQFKDQATGKTGVTLLWNGQTDVAPSSRTVYLQIYNTNSNEWETIDSDSATGANTDFYLTAAVSNLANYKDTDGIITCRVYQQAS